MSELKINFDSPVVAYGTALAGGAAVGSLVPTASKFVKNGIKGMADDSYIKKAALGANNLKNGAVTRLKNAARALFEVKPLASGEKPSAIREFAGACKKFAGQTYNWFNSKPMAKWAAIGAAVGAAGLFAYNKIVSHMIVKDVKRVFGEE